MAEPLDSNIDNHDRIARIQALVDSIALRRGGGESIADESIVKANPDLMPELQEELNKLNIIGRARNHANQPKTDIAETVDHKSKHGGSRGLHIRCPHCSNGVELLADTPFEDITCATCGSTFNLAAREDETALATPLRNVGRFELVSRLGVGGFGTVWKARDTELDRVVAVKIPRKGQLEQVEIEQFFREARSAAQLRHPNIVPVHEVGREQDTLFIVCDLVRGISLSDWLTGQRPDFGEVSKICQTVADALHHAHEQGVIHRDLKPSNIMMDLEGEPHLMDFGLAKREANEVTMTIDGQILGTPAYMSPEQAAGKGHWTDRRTDIYSLGVILFELLTGEQPFRGNAQMQVHQRLTEDAPDPRKLNRHVPQDLATICQKCLERDPNRRYSSATKVSAEFRRFLQGKPILSRPISRFARAGRWCKRNPAIATAAVLTTILAVAGPLTAWRIDTQRRRLGDLIQEKNQLITRISDEKEASVNEQSRLKLELEKWTGRTNPWNLWPPQQDKGPRRTMLKRAYSKHYRSLRATLEKVESLTLEQRAAAQLSLALLADATEKREQAKDHYEAARDILFHMRANTPENHQLTRALAQCCVQLSRLYGREQKTDAEKSLSEASALYEMLSKQSSDREYLVARIDSEMRRAVFSGYEKAGAQLEKASQLSAEIDQDWPTDPIEIYKLVNVIVGQSPLLTTAPTTNDQEE